MLPEDDDALCVPEFGIIDPAEENLHTHGVLEVEKASDNILGI